MVAAERAETELLMQMRLNRAPIRCLCAPRRLNAGREPGTAAFSGPQKPCRALGVDLVALSPAARAMALSDVPCGN
jgi:hypothetical protein